MDKTSQPDDINLLKQPLYKAVLFAFEKCDAMFPNNKGKIYISNILAYFVNDKNKDELRKKFGIVPKLSKDELSSIFKTLAKNGLIKINEGSRSAVFAYLNKDVYKTFLEKLDNTKNALITNEHVKHIGYAANAIESLFPNNKGKIYVSNILGFFVNEINHKKLLSEINCVPSYSKEFVENVVDRMEQLKLVKKFVGKNGAVYFILNKKEYESFLATCDKVLTDEDNYKIIFAVLEINKLFPNNKGRVYATNIASYFVNELNHPKIIEKFGEVTIYDVCDINKIFDDLSNLNLFVKVTGNRGASYIQANIENCEKYMSTLNKTYDEQDYRLVLQCIKHLGDMYPNNKGKVYVSNISAFIKMDRNVILLTNELGFYHPLGKYDIECIIDKLKEKKLIGVFEGHRGATYVLIYRKALDLYFGQKREFTDNDYKAIIFASEKLIEMYPANKGKVYVSNLSAYFKNDKNKDLLVSEFGTLPVFNKYEIEMIVKKLSDDKVLYRHEGNRGATYVTLDKKKADVIFKPSRTDFTDDDYKAIVFATRCLREKYPANKGKVYVSNIHAFFRIDANHDLIVENLGSHPKYEKEELEKIVEKLSQDKVLCRHEGNRGATYVTLDDAMFNELFGVREFTDDDYKAIVFAVRHLREKYPANKGKVYVSNIHAFFRIDANHDLIVENLGSHPKYSKIEIEEIVKKLSNDKILYRHEGNRGATYVSLDDTKFNELYGIREFTDDDYKAIVFAIKILRAKYPKNKGKVYISNIHAFFRIDANHYIIMDNLGSHPIFTKPELENIVKILADNKVVYRHEGDRGATYVTLDDKAFEEFIGDVEATPEEKENIIKKILFIMNGKCYISTMQDILFNEKSPFIGLDDNLTWLNKYFPKRKSIKDDDELADILFELHNNGLICRVGKYVALTAKGIIDVQKF